MGPKTPSPVHPYRLEKGYVGGTGEVTIGAGEDGIKPLSANVGPSCDEDGMGETAITKCGEWDEY